MVLVAPSKSAPASSPAYDFILKKVIDRTQYLPDPLVPQDISPLIADIPQASSVSDLGQYNLDVVIDTTNDKHIQPNEVAAHYGIWKIQHGSDASRPVGLLETLADAGVIHSTLLVQMKGQVDRVVYQSWTRAEAFCVRDNARAVYWKSLDFVPRALSALDRLGADAFFKQCSPVEENCAAFPPLATLFKRNVLAKANTIKSNRKTVRQWQLRYHTGEVPATRLHEYKPIDTPAESFYADPFIAEHEGRYYVFLEELPFATNRGHISVIPFDENLKPGKIQRVLEQPFHLSYPYLFQYEDKWYMIPESAENRTVDVYACEQFPDRWVHQKTLLADVKAVDATLYHDGSHWWMFVCISPREGVSTSDELHLYRADSPFGEWKPHPQNPVISDCRTARPAGKLFMHKGHLYRPSQNCAKRYGFGFNLNRVDVLSESEYVETTVECFVPYWDNKQIATHTFSHCGELSVIDVQVMRPI